MFSRGARSPQARGLVCRPARKMVVFKTGSAGSPACAAGWLGDLPRAAQPARTLPIWPVGTAPCHAWRQPARLCGARSLQAELPRFGHEIEAEAVVRL